MDVICCFFCKVEVMWGNGIYERICPYCGMDISRPREEEEEDEVSEVYE